MNTCKILTVMLLAVLLLSCQNASYKKLSDGVIIRLKPDNALSARNVRLQVVTDDIIHVTATTVASISLATGEVIFSDINGNRLLAENKGGGKKRVP